MKIIFFLILTTSIVSAQPDISNDSAKTFMLSVVSNLDNARVFIDTAYAGNTPLRNFQVKQGSYIIKVINPNSLENWEHENKIIEVYIHRDTVLNADFKYFYSINSNPFDAIVFRNDSAMGNTPLRFFSNSKLSGILTLKKKNYMDYILDLNNYDFNKGAYVTLKSNASEYINDVVYKNRGTQFKTKRDLFAITGFGVAALTGAYMAILFKNKANDAYSKYLVDSNPDHLNTSNQNDTYFTISLVFMQAAVGALIYFLFFDK